jgi:Family of unknown function (DUF5677)/SEC-C motif
MGIRPEVTSATDGIATLYADKLGAAEALVDFALEVAEPWRGRAMGHETDEAIIGRDRIVAGLLVRASNTNWAAIELCRIGFAEKALVLERTLFEDMADIYWTAQSDAAEVAERFKAHEDHQQLLLYESMAKHPDVFDVSALPTQDATRRAELDAQFGTYGDKPWTGLSIHKRIEEVQGQWTEGPDREWLQFFRGLVHRLNNAATHVTSHSLLSVRSREDEDGMSFHIGPSARVLEGALWNSIWIYGHILRLALSYFDFPQEDRDKADRLRVQGWALFKTLAPEDLRDVGRNDPCPCGSGRKFKRCHGA